MKNGKYQIISQTLGESFIVTFDEYNIVDFTTSNILIKNILFRRRVILYDDKVKLYREGKRDTIFILRGEDLIPYVHNCDILSVLTDIKIKKVE